MDRLKVDESVKPMWSEVSGILEEITDYFQMLDLLKKETAEMMNAWTMQERYLDAIVQLHKQIERPAQRAGAKVR